MLKTIWVGLASLTLASAAQAQTAEAPSPACELHIWPAERMASVTTGLPVSYTHLTLPTILRV